MSRDDALFGKETAALTGSPNARHTIEVLLNKLDAQAAGLWVREDKNLRCAAFVPCGRLPADVAREFEERTRLVGLDQENLGIVQAALRAEVVESILGGPSTTGSAHWLAKFDAARSVAVPLRDEQDRVVAIASVALQTHEPPATVVGETIRQHMQEWLAGGSRQSLIL